jgi:hypothetical protein
MLLKSLISKNWDILSSGTVGEGRRWTPRQRQTNLQAPLRVEAPALPRGLTPVDEEVRRRGLFIVGACIYMMIISYTHDTPRFMS